MNKFSVGDKVVRLQGGNTQKFLELQGAKAYYTVTSTSPSGSWLGLDNVGDLWSSPPWNGANFALYEGPEDDELPPAPASVMYYNSTTDADNFQHMLVQPHWDLEGHLSVAVIKSGHEFDPMAYGDILSINLDADAALQLAHDLRRMAMEIKRQEKTND